MKKVVIIILIIIVGFISYQIGKKYLPPVIIKPVEEKEKNLTCPYKMKGGIFKEFVRSANEVEIISVPKFIENPEVIKISKPFNKKELETELDKFGPSGLNYKEFDVDEDGKEETIVSYNTTMNHTPNVALIVKNGNIIFEAQGGSIWIEEADFRYGQGFTLSQEVDRLIGEYKKTRYVFKNGGFIPVWNQKICYVQFE